MNCLSLTLENTGSSTGYTLSCCHICVLSFSIKIKLLIIYSMLTVLVFSYSPYQFWRSVFFHWDEWFSDYGAQTNSIITPWELVKMPVLGPSPRAPESEVPGGGAQQSVLTGLCFINKAGDANAHWSIRISAEVLRSIESYFCQQILLECVLNVGNVKLKLWWVFLTIAGFTSDAVWRRSCDENVR